MWNLIPLQDTPGDNVIFASVASDGCLKITKLIYKDGDSQFTPIASVPHEKNNKEDLDETLELFERKISSTIEKSGVDPLRSGATFKRYRDEA